MSPKQNKPADHPAPRHLSRRATAFWDSINEKYVLEPHDLERLRVVCEQVDTIDACEAAIRKDGLAVVDRYGCKKPHPLVNVARDARALLMRGLREMCLDVELPTETRTPRQSRRYS